MPLILAIEPDRRQASQLTAMVRGRLHAELVLGESAERALAALGQRVPDLILTSALLSPKDENALGERLRALDGAAAHVQTLTIPVLASASGRHASRAGGVLSALRRDKGKAAATPDGCDPAVFAEQCKEYLERAETERSSLAEQAATAVLDAQAEASIKPADAPPSIVKPAPSLESKKAKTRATEHQSIVLPPHEPVEPAETFRAPVHEQIDPYVATATDAVDVIASHVEEPAPEPVVKRKTQKPSKRRQPQGIRSVLGLTQDDSDGPASLLAAVAALEAEEHVEPIIAPIVDAPPTFDPPIVVTPVVDAPIVASHSFDPLVSYTPSLEASVVRPPAVVAPTFQARAEELLDLSSLLDTPSTAPARRAYDVQRGACRRRLRARQLAAHDVVRRRCPAADDEQRAVLDDERGQQRASRRGTKLASAGHADRGDRGVSVGRSHDGRAARGAFRVRRTVRTALVLGA